MRTRLFQLGMLLAWPLLAVAEERFPPPEFGAEYRMPRMTTPAARAEWLAFLDIALLAVALALAAYLVHKRRSRTGLFALMLGSLAYFGFYRHGCVCSVGAIQNVAQAAFQHDYALPLSVAAFFLLPLLFALFFGRVFCAAVCPLGAVQDVVLLKPRQLPVWLERALGLLAQVYLGVAVLFAATGSAYLICRYDPFVAFFRFGGTIPMLAVGVFMLALGTVIGRPYCRFFCPYGVLLRWLAPFAQWRVRITRPGTACVQCRLCEEACPYGAIHPPTSPVAAGGRHEGKGRLVLLLALLPVLLLFGGVLGYFGSSTLALLHPTVRLTQRVWLEDHGAAQGTIEESDAFRNSGEPVDDLIVRGIRIRRQFAHGSAVLGGWLGLVIGLQLIGLSIRRRRTEYEADPAACLACGRCYRFCPEQEAQNDKGKTVDDQPVA